MGRRNRKVKDILERKKMELNECVRKFDSACSVVTNAVDALKELNYEINDKIREIDDYTEELSNTRKGLNETKDKNERVIKNFNALLGIEE